MSHSQQSRVFAATNSSTAAVVLSSATDWSGATAEGLAASPDITVIYEVKLTAAPNVRGQSACHCSVSSVDAGTRRCRGEDEIERE